MRVLGISGSLRAGSYNRQLLELAGKLMPEGVEFEVYDRLADIPPYVEDAPASESVTDLRDRVSAADAVLIATPEYNGSIPGQLKNALDWASRPFPDNSFKGRPTAVIGASVGLYGAIWSQAELRKVLGLMGAAVLDEELPIGQADQAFGADGGLSDTDGEAALSALVSKLVDAVRAPTAP